MAESTHLKIQVLIVDEFFVGATCLLSFFGMKDDDIWWNPTGVYCVFFGVRSFKQSTGLKGFSRGPQKASGHLSREVPRNPMRRFTGMLPHEDMIGKWFIAVGRFCTGPRPFARHKWGYINGPTCRIWITAFICIYSWWQDPPCMDIPKKQLSNHQFKSCCFWFPVGGHLNLSPKKATYENIKKRDTHTHTLEARNG